MSDMYKAHDCGGAVAVAMRGAEPSHFRLFGGSFAKRLFDVGLAAATAPIWMAIIAVFALIVRLDGGPAFYSQERVGRNGRRFRCWKIRSMIVDADEVLKRHLDQDPRARAEWDVRQKLRCDPRVTWLGRFIRAVSIDELPQLWNVLRGDMSLVGPRPFMPEQAALYPGNAYYRMRPGITGLWQVGDRNDTSFAARAAYDTRYEQEMGLITDIAILWRTVGVVLRGTGQ